jgi:hypothetical protein
MLSVATKQSEISGSRPESMVMTLIPAINAFLSDRDHRLRIASGENDSINSLGDEVFQDGSLSCDVPFIAWSFPDNLHAFLFARFLCTSPNCKPKIKGDALSALRQFGNASSVLERTHSPKSNRTKRPTLTASSLFPPFSPMRFSTKLHSATTSVIILSHLCALSCAEFTLKSRTYWQVGVREFI